MIVLSLFDGMSCGQIALKELGIKVDKYLASEVDRFAISQTQLNFPNTIQLGSVTELEYINGVLYKGDNVVYKGDIDLLIGGSPCQNLSFAGNQKGLSTKEGIEITSLEQYLELKEKGFEFEGESYLFWEFIKLKEQIKPKYFLLENVRISNKWKAIFDKIVGVDPVEINSSLVSAQNRVRYYWTDIPVDKLKIKDKNLVLEDIIDRNYSGRYVKDTDRNLRHERSTKSKSLCCTATMYKGAGNNGMTLIRHNGNLRCLTVDEVSRLQTIPKWYKWDCSNTQRYKMLGNGWTVDVIKHIFSCIYL